MRLQFLFFFSTLIYCSEAQKFTLLTGTYTGSGSKGIYVYRFNTVTGKADLVHNTDSVVNPSYLVVSKNSRYVYAVNETHGDNPGRISAFRYNISSGTLNFINSQLTGGDDPCYVSVTKNGKWADVNERTI